MTRIRFILMLMTLAIAGVSGPYLPALWRKWTNREPGQLELLSDPTDNFRPPSRPNESPFALRRDPVVMPRFGLVTDRGSVRRVLIDDSELRVVHAAKQEQSGKELLQVGTSTDHSSISGWITTDDVRAWNSAVVRPIPTTLAPRTIPLYELPVSCAELAVNGLPERRPLARVANEASSSDTHWPLLAEQAVSLRGHEFVAFRVGARRSQSTTGATQPRTSASPERRRFDVVIVIDNTYSSDLFLAAARQAVADLARELGLEHDIAFAVVLYRDYSDGLYFGANREVTKLLGQGRLTTQRDELLRLLRPITPASYSSGDFPEAVFDGMFVALKNIPWREASHRFVVLFGDSSSHPEDSPKNPYGLSVAKITRLAREQEARVVSVFVEGAGGTHEQWLHRRQKEELAEQTDGAFLEMSDLPQLSRHLRTLGHPVPEPATASNSSGSRVTIGWTLASIDGQPLFERGWLLSRKQVTLLRTELAGLVANLQLTARSTRSLDSGSDGDGEVPREVVFSRSSLFFSEAHDETWAAMLRRAGVPVSPGELDRTQRDLLTMPSAEQARLVATIHRDWLTPLTSFENSLHAADSEDVFVPVTLLP